MSQSHYCRCHVCGHINVNKVGRVMRCDQCRKTLAQFYYFDDRLIAIYSDKNLRPEYKPYEVKPIYGLTAYWENSSLE